MATISEKNTRRYRVQFTITRTLHQAYESNLNRAKNLHVVIDFTRDFEKWFSNQLEQVSRELQQLDADQSMLEAVEPATQKATCKTVSADHSLSDRISMEGGADHGDHH